MFRRIRQDYKYSVTGAAASAAQEKDIEEQVPIKSEADFIHSLSALKEDVLNEIRIRTPADTLSKYYLQKILNRNY